MSRPIIPILIAYISGLVAGSNLVIPFHIIIALIFISASLTAVSVLVKKLPTIFFTFSILTLFILGIGRMEAVLHPSFPDNHIANLISDEPVSLEGTVCDPPERGLDRVRLYVDLSALYIGDTPYPVTGKLLLTIGNTTLEGHPIPTPTLPLKGREFQKLRYGDSIRFLARVKRPRNFHNPGGFDYERYLAMRGVYATAYLKSADWIVKTGEATPSFGAWIEGMRGAIRDNIYKNAGESAPLLIALVTGDQGEIPKDVREAFSRAGTAHILAISGEHIGMIILASFFIFLRLLKRSERLMLTINIYKAAAVLAIPCVVLYTLIAGAGFSIVRAAVMGGTVLAAVLMDRRKDVPSLIALAAFLILVFEPQAVFDVSFQLSFASVISIALILPYLKGIFPETPGEAIGPNRLGRILSWAKALSLITLAATLGTAPLVAHYFNRVSIISPLSNLMIVPVIGFLIVPSGLLSSILIPVSQSISGLLVSTNAVLISVVLWINAAFASLPFASFRVVTPNLFEMAGFYLLIISLAYRKEFRWAGRLVFPLMAAILALESFYILRPWFQKELKITFLDVGQGESALIQFPGGNRMLIDGGGMATEGFDIGERVIAPFLWHNRIRSIDYMVLSHPNSDHYSGLPFILRNFNVGEVWESGVGEGSEGYKGFKDAIEKSALPYREVADGDILEISGATVEILNPPEDYVADNDRAANNGSLVLRIKYGKASFLFTGDIEKETEVRLLSKGGTMKSAVIKAPHHGSLTSSTVDFLEAVRPEKAVFSVGFKNRFGFPKEAVLKRYREIGAGIYRTDRDGAIIVATDGENTEFYKSSFFY